MPDIEKESSEITPLPFWPMVCLSMVQLSEAFNSKFQMDFIVHLMTLELQPLIVTVLFPFMAFMIEDMGYTGSRLGYYVGGLAAAFSAAEFFSSLLWGLISDKYGRKFAIISGTLGAAGGMFVFGTATTFTQAMIGRILSGFLCGNIGVVKTLLTEITDDTNRGKGFSYFGVNWSIGCLIAPLIGGLLAKPTEKYPTVFAEEGVFGHYPYLLPCLICIGLSVVSVVFCSLFMEETLKPHHKKSHEVEMVTLSEADLERGEVETITTSSSEDSDDKTTIYHPISSESINSQEEDENEFICNELHCFSLFSTSYASVASSEHGDNSMSVTDKYSSNSSSSNSSSSVLDILKRRKVLLSVSSYSLLAMGYILYDETLPLFLKLHISEGGFSFDSGKIGLLISISSIVLLFFNFLILPIFAAKSKKWLYEIGIIGAIPLVLAWPVLAILHVKLFLHVEHEHLKTLVLWSSLLVINILKNICACFSFTAVAIEVNHSVEDGSLGTVNGISQSFAALARAIGPAVGGVLWSLSIDYHFVFLNFLGVIGILVMGGYVNRLLPNSIETKKKKKKRIEKS